MVAAGFEPSTMMAIWSAGIVAGVALVLRMRVVGAPYVWVSGGAAAIAGVFAALAGPWGVAALVSHVIGLVLAKQRAVSSVALGIAAVGYTIQASASIEWWLVITGAVALGGITCEMLLGHWYLVDPTLPRSALRLLGVIGVVGMLADVGVLTLAGVWSGTEVWVWAWAAVAVGAAVLIAMAWAALKEQGYESVMAATGLSYLSILTALPAVWLGRSILAGLF